jgi:hypothetical protein
LENLQQVEKPLIKELENLQQVEKPLIKKIGKSSTG